MDFEYKLINIMRQHGLIIDRINLHPGVYHRFKSEGLCKKKCCEYRVFERRQGAHFRCWRRGIEHFWIANRESRMSVYEQHLLAIERHRVKLKRLSEYTYYAEKCAKFFQRCLDDEILLSKFPYVVHKNIRPFQARLVRNMCVLPIRDIHYKIQSLQFIKKNGFKQFKHRAAVNEGMIWLCSHLPDDYCGVLRICEGWSTGCTIRAITKSPVICGLNAFNLLKVAQAIHRRYKKATVYICADNDQWSNDNVGLRYAKEAAQITNFSLQYPDFSGLNIFSHPTDFNDLFSIAGKEVVKSQLIITRK